MEVDYDEIKTPRRREAWTPQGSFMEGHGGYSEKAEKQLSFFRMAWEGFRDLCYIIQDSKIFQHLTTAMILCNAVVLAITWCVITLNDMWSSQSHGASSH